TEYALRRLGLPQTAPVDGATLLDLGCGTGSVAVELAERGYRVIGIDGSIDMLAVAQRKVSERQVDVRLLHQGLTDFVLEAPVDGIVCLCDTLNYLTEDGQLQQALQRIAAGLKPGARALFDLHTEARLRELGESAFA